VFFFADGVFIGDLDDLDSGDCQFIFPGFFLMFFGDAGYYQTGFQSEAFGAFKDFFAQFRFEATACTSALPSRKIMKSSFPL